MLNGSTKGESKNLFIGLKGSPEAEVLDQGTETGTGTGTGKGREAVAEVEVEVIGIVIVERTGSIITEAGAGLEAKAEVQVLLTAGSVDETNMMMIGADEVGLMRVLPLLGEVLVPKGVLLWIKALLQRAKVLMLAITGSGQLLLRVYRLVVAVILGALLQDLKLMTKEGRDARGVLLCDAFAMSTYLDLYLDHLCIGSSGLCH